jgi:hypothetical protein
MRLAVDQHAIHVEDRRVPWDRVHHRITGVIVSCWKP